jgi:hypothetical protein
VFRDADALRNSTRLQAFLRGGGSPDSVQDPKVTTPCRANAGGCGWCAVKNSILGAGSGPDSGEVVRPQKMRDKVRSTLAPTLLRRSWLRSVA